MNKIKITTGLAEVAGIHAGDGYLRYLGKRKELDISGGFDEKDYYDNHVIPLFNKEFGLTLKGKFFHSRRTYGFVIRDRLILNKFKELGFPSGSKTLSVTVPDVIASSHDLKIISRFVRGVFDTDGCLNFTNRRYSGNYSDFKKRYHYYPRIMLRSVSIELIRGLRKLLDRIGLTYYIKHYKNKNNPSWNTSYELYLVGVGNLCRWMNIVGIKNPTKYSRYLIWKKFGFCPPRTTYHQRINILNGSLNPY